MRRSYLLVAGLALVGIARGASAQSCMGTASFNSGAVRLGGGAFFAGEADTYGASAAYGSNRLFGQLNFGRTSYDGVEGSSTVIGGGLGYRIPVASSRRVEVCPGVTISRSSGPEDEASGTDAYATTFTGGAQMGMPIRHSDGLTFVPTAGLAVAHTSVELTSPLGDFNGSETYALLSVGTGLVLNSVITVQPLVTFPIGLDNADTSFGLTASMNFGSRQQTRPAPGRRPRR
jgi:hypothetical protein